MTKNNILTDRLEWNLSDRGVSLNKSDSETVASFGYNDIKEVHLQYAPTRYVGNRFTCKIKTNDGRSFWFSNFYFKGLMDFEEHSNEYTEFVKSLCSNIAKNNNNCRFVIGSGQLHYYLNVLALVFTAVMLIIAAQLIIALGLTWMILIKLAVIVVLAPRAVNWVQKNKFQTFLPEQIPQDMLPKK